MAEIASSILFNVAIVISTSFIVGEIFERIGLESVIGYIFTGLVLGPAVLGTVDPSAIKGFGTIGAALILFQAGLREESVKDIFSHREGLDLGLGVLIGTFLVIATILTAFGDSFIHLENMKQVVFVALAYSVVDIGVPSKIMLSKGMLRQKIGKYTIKSAVINVTSGLAVLTVLVLLSSPTVVGMAVKIAGIAIFTALFFLLHEFIHKLDDYVLSFEEVEAEFAITLGLLLSMSYITEIIGLSSVLGAFFAGVIISRSDFGDTEAFQEKISALSEGFFIPLFFAWFGLGLKIFGEYGILSFLEAAVFLFSISIISKLAIGYYIVSRHGREQPLKIAASLLALDIETLVILLIGIDIGVFHSHHILEIFAPSVVLGTLTITVLYKISDYRSTKQLKRGGTEE